MYGKKKMMGGGKVMKYKQGGAITSKSKGKKSKGGCQNRLYM
jgi:hypothetical protein